jgi:hypothetical protein
VLGNGKHLAGVRLDLFERGDDLGVVPESRNDSAQVGAVDVDGVADRAIVDAQLEPVRRFGLPEQFSVGRTA